MKKLYMSIILFCLFISISYADDALISHRVIGTNYVGCYPYNGIYQLTTTGDSCIICPIKKRGGTDYAT